MQLTLKALFDEDTRKQLREVILGQAKSIARSELTEVIRAELEKKIALFLERITSQDRWGSSPPVSNLLTEAIGRVIQNKWSEIGSKIDAAMQKAADTVIAEKMKNKTVFEAEQQEMYMRQLIRSELRKLAGAT